MPKIKKFKELSRRQQNRRLLLAAENDNISVCFPKRLLSNKQDISSMECSLENQNCNIIQPFPGYIQNIQSENENESDNNIENYNLLYINRDERKTLQEQLHFIEHLSNKNNRLRMPVSVYTRKPISTSNNHSTDEELDEYLSDKNDCLRMPVSTYMQRPISTSNNHSTEELDEHLHIEENMSNVNEVDINDDLINVNDINDARDAIQYNRCHTCCEACRKTQQTIKRKLDFIINLIENKNTASTHIEQGTSLLPQFPLITVKQFDDFEKDLQDREIRKQFKNKIAKIGGKNYADNIRKILRQILHDDVAKKISWTGQKGTISIKNSRVASIIIDYVSNSEDCTFDQLQKVIREWLKHAGDRINYYLKKHPA